MDKTLGQIAYEAHSKALESKLNYAVPTWAELSADVQTAWEKAAYAVRKEIGDPRRSLRDNRQAKPL